MDEKLRHALWGRIQVALQFDGDPAINIDACRTAFFARVDDQAWTDANPYPDTGSISARLSWVQAVTLGLIAETTGTAVELNREPIPVEGKFEDAGPAAAERPPPQA
jgi:hypothetical protein